MVEPFLYPGYQYRLRNELSHNDYEPYAVPDEDIQKRFFFELISYAKSIDNSRTFCYYYAVRERYEGRHEHRL